MGFLGSKEVMESSCRKGALPWDEGVPTFESITQKSHFYSLACGCQRLQQALWEERKEWILTGKLQTQLNCIQSQPTHWGTEKHSVHTQIFGNNFLTGNNSEAGSQSSTGICSSLEFILLWKGLLGHLARPRLPESLKSAFGKRVSGTLLISYATDNGILVITFVSDDQLATEECWSQQMQRIILISLSSKLETPGGSTARSINAHSW